ncbi:fused response regulator/phosphatase [Vibrio genomosp. F10]|uniref:Two-component system sensor histidine kinase/response regulator n=3 Tax=Vibrio genomosp. F10 TaxID=723171 RepID=A0A1B9R2R6_9VIBR|nr:fused response regulator/phosphatase [Vibrio genomosp. F10]OCH78583.1 two-component system sensor histidine kinase/response regulator [Vibrio genomosp. F10]OEE30708.1 two-component system sensor histidine kinase/response regulator [Vibrio genomosp. F10 str. ZF-129]
MRVMIVDDNATNREICRCMIQDLASHIDTFENGEDVVPSMKKMEALPDIILLDVMMPVKDGFTTAIEIREAFPNIHIAILFLTVLDDNTSYERCLNLGDDFISKPFERTVIHAKIQAHYRIVKIHKEVVRQRDELSHFHEQVQYDYSISESIFSNLVEEMSAQTSHIFGVNYISTPSTVFNGDLIIVANRPHGGAYVMVADATGHGLPAAISAIPATRAFFSMAEKGLSLGEIVNEINNSLSKFLPIGMMLAASIFEIRANGFEVSWWGGGLPDTYVLDENSKIIRRLVSKHMPLGVLDSHEFETDIVHLILEPGQQIVSYTDGITEAMNEHGEQFGQERLEKALENGQAHITTVHEAVRAFSNMKAGDDLSILSMTFPIINGNDNSLQLTDFYYSKIPMKTGLHFPAHVLRTASVLSEVRQYLSGILNGGQHLDLVCSVLSELFANAIEHGLLGLKSSLKESPDGFFEFYQLREERLKDLSPDAWVKLDIDYQPEEKIITMLLEHNGEGFDYHHLNLSAQNGTTHGRGIVLATELCDSLEYSNEGKSVTAVYHFNASHRFPSSA